MQRLSGNIYLPRVTLGGGNTASSGEQAYNRPAYGQSGAGQFGGGIEWEYLRYVLVRPDHHDCPVSVYSALLEYVDDRVDGVDLLVIDEPERTSHGKKDRLHCAEIDRGGHERRGHLGVWNLREKGKGA